MCPREVERIERWRHQLPRTTLRSKCSRQSRKEIPSKCRTNKLIPRGVPAVMGKCMVGISRLAVNTPERVWEVRRLLFGPRYLSTVSVGGAIPCFVRSVMTPVLSNSLKRPSFSEEGRLNLTLGVEAKRDWVCSPVQCVNSRESALQGITFTTFTGK